jgi:hypothetical protein
MSSLVVQKAEGACGRHFRFSFFLVLETFLFTLPPR